MSGNGGTGHTEEIRARTRRLEREEFERGHREPGQPPATPHPAATMVLARPAPSGFEVLLLKRPEESRFAAGAWVFAGGRVDQQDADPAVHDRLDTDGGGGEPQALVAAIREQFEETGLLVGGARADPGRVARARRALLSGRTTFPEVVRELELDFRALEVAYFARWITPEKLARRYDARFFLSIHPGGEPELIDELVEAAWLRPGRALDEFSAGELPLLFPTRKTLEALAAFGGLDEALADLRRRPVRPVRPRLLVGEEGVEPVLPGEDGYGRAGRQDLDRAGEAGGG